VALPCTCRGEKQSRAPLAWLNSPTPETSRHFVGSVQSAFG